VQLITEPPMGGLTEEHAGCHVATSAAGCWQPADAYTPGRPRCRRRRWWYQVHAVRPGRRLVVRAQFSASTESGAAVRQRFARGPSERRSCLGIMTQYSVCPKCGHYVRFSDIMHIFDGKPGSISNPARAVGALASRLCTLERSGHRNREVRRPSVGGRSLSPERPNETPRDLERRPIPADRPLRP